MNALNHSALRRGPVARVQRDPGNQNTPSLRVLRGRPIVALHWFGVDLGEPFMNADTLTYKSRGRLAQRAGICALSCLPARTP